MNSVGRIAQEMRIVDTTMCAAQWIVFVFDEAIISLAVNSINFIIVICRALIQDSQAKISILCTDFMFYGDGNSKYLFSLDVCVCALYEGWHLKMNRRNHVHAHSNNTQHTVNCWFLLQWCDLSLNETNVTVNEEINLLSFITDWACICNNLLDLTFPSPDFLCFNKWMRVKGSLYV